jgi:2OG-Fe(II) oxygenase superfamily
MLRLGRRATLSRPDGSERAALRRHFDEHYWARFPAVLDPELLGEVQHLLERATFVPHRHEQVSPPSVDWIMSPGPASALLEMLFNDPAIFHDIEAITGCAPVSRFASQLYRMVPDQGHEHHWHNDLMNGRMIGMSVNLGPHNHDGGVFELRDRPTGRILGVVPNPVPGDAIIFALDPSLQHRVTRVTAGEKTAFAGWFCAGPSYVDLLRSAATS